MVVGSAIIKHTHIHRTSLAVPPLVKGRRRETNIEQGEIQFIMYLLLKD